MSLRAHILDAWQRWEGSWSSTQENKDTQQLMHLLEDDPDGLFKAMWNLLNREEGVEICLPALAPETELANMMNCLPSLPTGSKRDVEKANSRGERLLIPTAELVVNKADKRFSKDVLLNYENGWGEWLQDYKRCAEGALKTQLAWTVTYKE